MSKKGKVYYQIAPSEKSIKKFKSDMKSMIKKSKTYSFEKWKETLNPVIRGKYNYFLISARACHEVRNKLIELGRRFHGYCFMDYTKLDGYVRHRLRVNFSCRGKKHGGQMQGKLLTVKYGNDFFIRDMGLVNGRYLLNLIFNPTMTIEEFVAMGKHKIHKKRYSIKKNNFFKYALAK